MICRLCLNNSQHYLNFFDENGSFQEMSSIVSKYFWFIEPKENDPISNIICNECWCSVDHFHKFYISIEEAQNNLKIVEYNDDNKELILKFDDENSKDFNNIADDVNLLLNKNDSNSNEQCIKLSIDMELEELESTKHITDSLLLDPLDENEEEQKINIVVDEIIQKEIQKNNLKTIQKKVGRPKKSEKRIKIDKKCKIIKRSKFYKIDPDIDQDEKILSFVKLVCDECGENFTKFMFLKRHIRTKHNRTGYAKCCNKKFYKRIFLLEHINIHLNPDYFRCEECNKSFSSRRSIENHNLTLHQTIETKIYKCNLCPRKYVQKYVLDQHYKIKHTDIEKMWKCDICDKEFVTKNRMITHKNYMHKNAYSKICEICAKVSRSKSIFDKHMLEHNGIIEPKLQCEQCNAWLKNALSLKKHMIRHKEENLQHICNICGKSAASKFALKNHLRYVHTEAIFKCTVCEKSFKKPIRLKEHMSTHTGEILYTCTLCPKTFISNANMWSHKKKAHRDQWETDRKNRKAPSDINLKENI